MEKSHEDIRVEEKVERRIASDAARDQCKPDVIQPDPQLYMARTVAHTPDHTGLVLYLDR